MGALRRGVGGLALGVAALALGSVALVGGAAWGDAGVGGAAGKAASAVAGERVAADAGARASAGSGGQDGGRWWRPGEGRTFGAQLDYADSTGVVRNLLHTGPLETRGHPFFEPLGGNGRACVTCHQPADAMSLAASSARERWDAAGVADPLFAAVDGSNCPTLPQQERSSHSLLLDYGLIRVERPWPPRDAGGKVVTPDFDIEVVRDPWGCNSGPHYGPTARPG